MACDGAQSRIRRQLGTIMLGREGVYDSCDVLLNADLRPWIQDRPASMSFVEQRDLRGGFMSINAIDRWCINIRSISKYGFTREDLTPERCITLIRQAAAALLDSYHAERQPQGRLISETSLANALSMAR